MLVAGCGGDGAGSDCPPDQSYFQERVWTPVMSTRCAACHSSTGAAAASAFVLDGEDMASSFEAAIGMASRQVDGLPLLLAKPSGMVAHGGGMVIAPGSADYAALDSFAAKVNGSAGACDDLVACRAGEPGPQLLRRLSRAEYDNTIRAVLGIDAAFGDGLTPDVVIGGFDNNAAALTVTPLLADQLRQAAEGIAAEVTARPDITACGGDGAACAQTFLAERGARIFRRPLTDDEVARWLVVYQVGADNPDDGVAAHRAGLELMIGGLLQSPAFLYRSELGEPDGSGGFVLTSYEIAAELSYLLWAEPPDDELWAAAVADQLRDPATIEAHARRLLASPRARASLDRFTTQWLAIGQLAIVAKDPAVYPELTPALRDDMAEEARRLVADVTQGGGTLSDLLTAPYTIASAELAAFYGLAPPASPDGDGFGRVDLEGTGRAGLLATGAVLTAHARANSSSPIHRGKAIRERLLCQELPPPPPGLNAEAPALDPDATTRDRYRQHSTDPACSGCHDLMDPIGFGFEHFDGIGRFRADEGGLAIDDTGEITGTESTNGSFEGVGELSARLAGSGDVSACFASEWLVWAYGMTDDASSACLIDELVGEFESADLVIEELIVALTQTSHFRSRKGDDGGGGGGGGGGAGGSGGGDQPDAGTGGGGDPGVTAEVVGATSWPTGYCATLRVTNGSDVEVAWQVTLAIDGTVYDHWNMDVAQTGADTTFSALSGAAPLAAGATSEQAGFCASL